MARDPGTELEAMFEREAKRLEDRRVELARARELFARVAGRAGGRAGGGLEPVPAERAPGVITDLLRNTRGALRNVVMFLHEGPVLDDEAMRTNEERIRAGRAQRSLYPAEVLESPASLRWIRSWSAIGEVQRLLPEVATEFAVFGDEAVVALAGFGDATSGYVLCRHPLVVDVHIAYFETLWAHAQPVPTAIGEHQDDERLIELLGLGLKDETIARLLGLGLRTVRRRVAALMAMHGADTRFQLGLAIGQRQQESR